MSAKAKRNGMARNRRQWLCCGVIAALAVCLIGGCKCDDKAAKKPDIAFCDNAKVWNQWESMVEQFSWDDGMMELHALRLGICSMIYTGQIEPERGIAIFGKAHFAWRKRIVRLLSGAQGSLPAEPPVETPRQGGQ